MECQLRDRRENKTVKLKNKIKPHYLIKNNHTDKKGTRKATKRKN